MQLIDFFCISKNDFYLFILLLELKKMLLKFQINIKESIILFFHIKLINYITFYYIKACLQLQNQTYLSRSMSSLTKFKSSSVKSLRSSSILENHNKLTIISKNPFEINPENIVFKNIEVDKDYQVKVQIRNLTKKPQRIRFQKFKNKRFSFQSIPQGQIAAGLTISLIVKFQCQQQIPESQILKVYSSDGFTQELIINTYPKQSKIIFEPFVNLGFVQQGNQCIKQIIFQNQGQKTGVLQFISNNDASLLTFEPQILNIQPKDKSTLTIKYKPNEAGYFKGIVEIKSKEPLAKNFLEIVSTSLEKARFIVNPDKVNTQASDFVFDFRTVYSGQKKVLRAFLINNSPKPMLFNSIIKKGVIQNIEEITLNHTPLQQANQEKQKVFHIKPEAGTVQEFSQKQLQIICESKITYKQKAYVKTYALADFSEEGSIQSMKNAKDFRHQDYFQYTAIIKSNDGQKPLIVQLKAHIECPQIKINKKSLLFGDCLLGQRKKQQIAIQNKNKSQKVSVQFKKIPYFDFDPPKFVLGPQKTKIIKVSFNPKTIGKIDQMQILYLNEIYQISLRCMGFVTNNRSMSQRQLTKISSLQKLNQSPAKGFHSRKLSMIQTERSKPVQNQSHLNLITNKKLGSLGQIDLDASNTIFLQNKQKFSKLLTSRREDREKKQQQKEMKHQFLQMKSKLQKIKKSQTYDDQGLPQGSPIDIEFEIGSSKNVKEREPSFSKNVDSLFVTKHIGSYEPQSTKVLGASLFHRTPEQKPKRIYPQVPQIFNQRRQIERQLSTQQLELIDIPQTKIYFGEVYIKSQKTLHFWIKNNTLYAISCRVFFKQQELQRSHYKAQTIPTCQQGGFPLIFCKNNIGQFYAEGYYIINEKYKYNLSVSGKSGEVLINMNKDSINFEFLQNNLQMSTQQNVILTNPGNSLAKFKFTLTKQRYFLPTIFEGSIESKQSLTVPITLNIPSNPKIIKKGTLSSFQIQQKLSLKILDGLQKSLNCFYQQQQPKFNVKCQLFTKKSVIFANSQLFEFIEIKNITKQPVVIHMETQGIEILNGVNNVVNNNNNENNGKNGTKESNRNLNLKKLRFMPDQNKKIKLKFIANKIGEQKCKISLNPRGGAKKDFQFQIKVISPSFDFSSQALLMDPLIVRSTKGQSYFTMTHSQQISIPIVFDFRPKKYNQNAPKYIQNLQIHLLNENQSFQIITPTLKSEEDQNIIEQNLFDQEIDIDQIQDRISNQSFDDEEENLQKDPNQLKRYKLLLKPKVQYKFKIQFIAPQVQKYSIKLPVCVQKSIQLNNSPTVHCQAIQPKFIFDPSNIDFKKKYLGKPDRSYPKIIQVIMKNENFQQMQWYLDDKQLLKANIFSFDAVSGTLQPNQQIKLKVQFNPFSIGEYNQKLPLFIKSKKQTKNIKFCDINLKGQASLPQIFFNKREAIMPVVPVGIQTKTFFRILNDGYDNCSFNYQFQDDVAGIDVKVHFPEGNNLSISKSKIKVDLSWKFDRPMSFTLLLTIKDDMQRKFVIPISGTTDNSILTNYTYFLRNQHHFKVKDQGSLQLIQVTPNQTTSTGLQRKHSSHSLKSNSTNRSIMSYMGVAPINPYILATTLQYIKKYLNQNILSIPINQFPLSIVQNDGKPILQVLYVTSGKTTKYPWIYQPTPNQKPEEKVKKLLNQYNQLLKQLKVQGALLNHIRPQYLLSFHDLNHYLGNLPEEKSKHYMPNLLKINSGLFNYLSVEAWITLLYQIFKVNTLARVTPKNIKEHVVYFKEHQIPSYYLEKSNFISVSQSILMNWCEESYHQILLKDIRIMNFDKDFKNGLIIASLVQRYAKNNLTARVVTQPKTQEDEKKNAKTICQSLAEMGLLAHIQPKYIFNPFQRQMVMLLLYLYMYLPAYIPQQKPIVFNCVLGQQIIKSIQLKNPSAKPIKYKTKYIGNSNFVLLSDQVFTIEPKSTFEFKIKYISKFVKQIKGRISFVNIKDTTGQGGSGTGSTLVFDLKSQTISILSEKIWKVGSNLYEPSQFTVQIDNSMSAPENTEFQIKIKTEYIYNERKKKIKGKQHILSPDEQVQVVLLKSQSLKIKRGTFQPLTFSYLPMSLHRTKTYLLFSNQVIGEFQHQIQATAQDPSLSAQIRPSLTMYSGQTYEWQYSINPKNQQILKAKKQYQVLTVKKNSKSNPLSSLSKSKVKIVQSSIKQKQNEPSQKTFDIEIEQNSFASLIENFVILGEDKKIEKKPPSGKNKAEQTKQDENKNMNAIKFKFTCKQPVYQFTMKFVVKDKKSIDVRRYRVIFTILPKPLSAVLEMTTPARKELIQNLPFINNTERDWNMKVTWYPGNGFSIPPNFASGFQIKRQSIINLPLSFKPKWKQQAEAKLVISNPATLDQFQYQIKGYVQDPLSQDHIQIKCEINQTIKKKIILQNPYAQKSITLRVETDISNFEGQNKITILPNGKFQYNFSITTMVCGEFNSSITFFQHQGAQYFWYTISISTNPPNAVKTVQIETEIRQRKIEKIKIPIKFKLQQQEEFQVKINGEGLIGPQKIKLHPLQKQGQQETNKNQISLQYLPLKTGAFFGEIYLVNPKVGQILINLNLVCHPRPPIMGHLIKSPLGVGSSQQIVLQNPINAKVSIRYRNSNPEVFIIHDNQKGHAKNSKKTNLGHSKQSSAQIIKLLPFQKVPIKVQYIPGNLQTIQKAQITFFSDDIGEWQFHFSGIGYAPTQFQPLLIHREVKCLQPTSISFKNPFNYAIKVGVKLLVDTQWKQIFRLSTIGIDVFDLQPHAYIQIPFVFVPESISKYYCTIKVLLSQKIFWSFPIVGVGQRIYGLQNIQNTIHIKTKCRQNVRVEKHIRLDNVQKYHYNNAYDAKCANVDQDAQNYVDMFLSCQLIKNSLGNESDYLTAQFIFKPMKPFKTIFDLAVDRKDGGRWVYKVVLQSISPDADDKIVLEGNLMTTSNISFRIANWQKKDAQFKAYFTTDSAHQFSVEPLEGILTKYGSKGTSIFLSFTPVEYGKDKSAKLIIQTDNMYWSYDLVGRLPKYVPPVKRSSILQLSKGR